MCCVREKRERDGELAEAEKSWNETKEEKEGGREGERSLLSRKGETSGIEGDERGRKGGGGEGRRTELPVVRRRRHFANTDGHLVMGTRWRAGRWGDNITIPGIEQRFSTYRDRDRPATSHTTPRELLLSLRRSRYFP